MSFPGVIGYPGTVATVFNQTLSKLTLAMKEIKK